MICVDFRTYPLRNAKFIQSIRLSYYIDKILDHRSDICQSWVSEVTVNRIIHNLWINQRTVTIHLRQPARKILNRISLKLFTLYRQFKQTSRISARYYIFIVFWVYVHDY